MFADAILVHRETLAATIRSSLAAGNAFDRIWFNPVTVDDAPLLQTASELNEAYLL